MAIGYNLGDLRAAIDDINREIVSEKGSGEVFNSDVLSRLKKNRNHLVDAYTPQLVDIALTKLLNEVSCRKAARNSNGMQSSLFEQYPGVKNRVAVAKGLKKDVGKFTPNELQEWKNNRSKKVVQDEDDGIQKLIDDCKNISISDNETIESILKRKITV